MTKEEEIYLLTEERVHWRTEAMRLGGKVWFAERQAALCTRRMEQIAGMPITPVNGLHDRWINGQIAPIARVAPIQHSDEPA